MTGQERRKLFENNLVTWHKMAQDNDMSHISSMNGFFGHGPEPVIGFNMLSIKPSSDLENFLEALALIKINRRLHATMKRQQKAANRRSQHGK